MRKTKLASKLIGLIATCAAVATAQAGIISPTLHAGEDLAKAASHPWDWHAGVASGMANGIYTKSKGYQIYYPYVGYKGGRLTIAGPSGWMRLAGPQMLHVSFGGTLLPDSFNPKRSSDLQMQKLKKRDFSVGVGFQGSMILKSVGMLNVRILRAFVGGNGGYFADASYTALFSRGVGGVSLNLIPSVGMQYYSAKLSNYYYGVSGSESTASGIAEYQAKANWRPYVGVALTGQVRGRVRAVISTKLAYLPDTVANSPIVDKRHLFTTTLVLSYAF